MICYGLSQPNRADRSYLFLKLLLEDSMPVSWILRRIRGYPVGRFVSHLDEKWKGQLHIEAKYRS